MANGNDLNSFAAAIRRLQDDNSNLKSAFDQIKSFLQGMASVPKYIEEIPGKRSPHFEVIEISFDANSTAKREGVTSVSVDGPFACTAVALFHQLTTGPYAGPWGPATTFGSKISPASQQFGFMYLFDSPICASFTVEITAHGAERLWQNKPVSSALYSQEAGGAYILPTAHLFQQASTIRLAATPDVSRPYAAKLQAIFLGYRILQGYQYQP